VTTKEGGNADFVWNKNLRTAKEGGNADFVWNKNLPSPQFFHHLILNLKPSLASG
jgi:hypothetical protein